MAPLSRLDAPIGSKLISQEEDKHDLSMVSGPFPSAHETAAVVPRCVQAFEIDKGSSLSPDSRSLSVYVSSVYAFLTPL
jgi:hypothetical protein